MSRLIPQSFLQRVVRRKRLLDLPPAESGVREVAAAGVAVRCQRAPVVVHVLGKLKRCMVNSCEATWRPISDVVDLVLSGVSVQK